MTYLSVPSDGCALNLGRYVRNSAQGTLHWRFSVREIQTLINPNITHSSSAPANRFVLATWCCDLYTQNIKSRDLFRNQKNADALLESLALLLDSLLRPEGQAKPAIRQTTISCTRRAIRSVSFDSSPMDNLPNALLVS